MTGKAELPRLACSGGKLNMLSKTGDASESMAFRTRNRTLSEDCRMTSALGLLKGNGASVDAGGCSLVSISEDPFLEVSTGGIDQYPSFLDIHLQLVRTCNVLENVEDGQSGYNGSRYEGSLELNGRLRNPK